MYSQTPVIATAEGTKPDDSVTCGGKFKSRAGVARSIDQSRIIMLVLLLTVGSARIPAPTVVPATSCAADCQLPAVSRTSRIEPDRNDKKHNKRARKTNKQTNKPPSSPAASPPGVCFMSSPSAENSLSLPRRLPPSFVLSPALLFETRCFLYPPRLFLPLLPMRETWSKLRRAIITDRQHEQQRRQQQPQD